MNTTHIIDGVEVEMHLEWAPDYRTLPKSKVHQKFRCKDCGGQVEWAVSKKQNTYLAVECMWTSDAHSSANGRTNQRIFYPAHDCEPNVEYQARFKVAMQMLADDREVKLQAGEMVVGAQVEVFKGRKVPKGTAGELFWIAPQPDAYGVIKAGFKTVEGEKHFLNIENIKVTEGAK
jgi:hypothetical protein